MNYITHNDRDINPNGTSLVDELECPYDRLIAAFGEPLAGDGYKVDVNWYVEFDDGTIATIYDWKTGINYCGESEGVPAEEQTIWHIGGFDQRASDYIRQVLETPA